MNVFFIIFFEETNFMKRLNYFPDSNKHITEIITNPTPLSNNWKSYEKSGLLEYYAITSYTQRIKGKWN